MRTIEFINRSVFALDEKIGTVKGIEVDSGVYGKCKSSSKMR